ncbi:uncharacterized protein LOC133184550 [Saccostrea echinata]|uniref:uncharacterized protein LOC133184550 n=1 Tax=Saccostrea echinata TaxID=191078 RepID=UPI002A801E81|nr:uncharacterized protein LOC133184550 [Saccostrea echinata]
MSFCPELPGFSTKYDRFGSPDSILTDRGQQFMSKVLTELCKIFEITKLKTSSYRPQTNAAVERANSSILNKLRTYIDAEQTNWPKLLAPITFAMNTTIATESTHYSPYYLLFGRECKTPLDTSLNPAEIVGQNAKEYVDSIHKELKKARELATRNIEEAQEKYKTQHDKRATPPEFRIHEKVWLRSKKKQVGLTPKLCNKWIGPFYIIEDNHNNTYKLRNCADNTELKSAAHADDLKPFHDPEIRPTNRLDPLPDKDEELSSSGDESSQADESGSEADDQSDAENDSVDDENGPTYNVEKIRGQRGTVTV